MFRIPRRFGLLLVALAMFCTAGLLLAQQEPLRNIPPVNGPEAITPADIFVFKPYERTFTGTEGPRTGQKMLVTQEQGQGEGDQAYWRLTIEGLCRMFVTRQEDGDLILTRMEQIDKNKAVEYRPAVLLLPSRLKAGTAIVQTGHAYVFDLDSGEHTRTGTYDHSIASVTRSQLRLPAGTMNGYLLAYEHDIDVPMATMKLDLDMAYVPDVGLVYLRQKSTVEKLGLFGETTISGLALAEQVHRE